MIEEKANLPKAGSNSKFLVRNKLAKDLNKAYDALVDEQPEIEGKPELLIKMLSLLQVFTEIKSEDGLHDDSELSYNNSDFNIKLCLDENNTFDSQCTMEYSCLTKMQARKRKELEKKCFDLMWGVLTFGGREVTKGLLLNLIHVLFTIEDKQATETKLRIIQEAAKVNGIETSLDLNDLLETFNTLAKDIRTHLSNFAKQFKEIKNSTEEKEINECTFNPSINNKSRKLDSNRKASGCPPKKFSLEQRSQSPPRHDILYENYKKIQKNLKKLSNERRVEEDKKLPFRPKISKPAEKYNEDKVKRVYFILISSSIDSMKIVRRN